MKIGITGLNYEEFFIMFTINNQWYHAKVPVHDFISIMWDNFPCIMKQSLPYHFDSEYQLANWLFNYGTDNTGDMYIFDDGNKDRYLHVVNKVKCSPPKHIVK